jgi:hypothetical protein
MGSILSVGIAIGPPLGGILIGYIGLAIRFPGEYSAWVYNSPGCYQICP